MVAFKSFTVFFICLTMQVILMGSALPLLPYDSTHDYVPSTVYTHPIKRLDCRGIRKWRTGGILHLFQPSIVDNQTLAARSDLISRLDSLSTCISGILHLCTIMVCALCCNDTYYAKPIVYDGVQPFARCNSSAQLCIFSNNQRQTLSYLTLS